MQWTPVDGVIDCAAADLCHPKQVPSLFRSQLLPIYELPVPIFSLVPEPHVVAELAHTVTPGLQRYNTRRQLWIIFIFSYINCSHMSYRNCSRVTFETPSQCLNLSRAASASDMMMRSIFSLRGTNLALKGSGWVFSLSVYAQMSSFTS